MTRAETKTGAMRRPLVTRDGESRQMTESTHSLILFFGIAPIRLAAT